MKKLILIGIATIFVGAVIINLTGCKSCDDKRFDKHKNQHVHHHQPQHNQQRDNLPPPPPKDMCDPTHNQNNINHLNYPAPNHRKDKKIDKQEIQKIN